MVTACIFLVICIHESSKTDIFATSTVLFRPDEQGAFPGGYGQCMNTSIGLTGYYKEPAFGVHEYMDTKEVGLTLTDRFS